MASGEVVVEPLLLLHPRLGQIEACYVAGRVGGGSPVSLLGQIPDWAGSGVRHSVCAFVVSGHVLAMLLVGVFLTGKRTHAFWSVCHNLSGYGVGIMP